MDLGKIVGALSGDSGTMNKLKAMSPGNFGASNPFDWQAAMKKYTDAMGAFGGGDSKNKYMANFTGNGQYSMPGLMKQYGIDMSQYDLPSLVKKWQDEGGAGLFGLGGSNTAGPVNLGGWGSLY
jgi:hypothetical protein